MGQVLMKQRPALPLLPLYMSLQRIQASKNTRHLSATCFTCSPLAVCGHLECTAASRGMRVFNAVCGMRRWTTLRLDIAHLLASGDDENFKTAKLALRLHEGKDNKSLKNVVAVWQKKCVVFLFCCFRSKPETLNQRRARVKSTQSPDLLPATQPVRLPEESLCQDTKNNLAFSLRHDSLTVSGNSWCPVSQCDLFFRKQQQISPGCK